MMSSKKDVMTVTKDGKTIEVPLESNGKFFSAAKLNQVVISMFCQRIQKLIFIPPGVGSEIF